MRVCIVAEGCYPYVVGGMSSWINNLIKSFPETEFIVLAIIANRTLSGKFVYELPDNVTEVHEVYLDDRDWSGSRRRHSRRIKKNEFKALHSLLLGQDTEWNVLFDMFRNTGMSTDDLLMGEDFFLAVRDFYRLRYPQICFSDFLWTMRSIYLPLFLVMKSQIPEADLYHCTATGYAGVLGSMAQHFYGSRLMISEHGIYAREREEELIRATWVRDTYKNIWIDQFYKLSKLAYDRADIVTCLYSGAKRLQTELGCPANKIQIISNGVNTDNLASLPGKTAEDEGKINIGAILRVVPIKDVKTMIQAFAIAKEYDPRLKLWIMGPLTENEEYARECFELVDMMGLQGVEFTGEINIHDYLGRMDMTILTSISEGQPLTILESFAAGKPVIATDVGDCRELVYGEGRQTSEERAGIITHIMNAEEIADAILELSNNDELRLEMGSVGYRRVMVRYRIEHMRGKYRRLYEDFEKSLNKDVVLSGEVS